MKKLIKNKLLVIAICVIVVSIVYLGVQNAIDNYDFCNNGDIIAEDGLVLGTEENGNGEGWEGDGQASEGTGQFSDEEIDLVLEDEEGENRSIVSESVDDDAAERMGESLGNEQVDGRKEVTEESKIYVYITGEVNNPGVVILNEGSRIVDAINAAGGTTIKANVSKVNLVYILDDGMKVNIPNNNDLKNDPDFEYITMNSGDGGNEDYFPDKSESSSSENSSSSSSGGYNSIVNINTATQTELESLPGIGPSLALKIINYRKENGKFSSIEDIKNVSGIGDSKFESLKAYITV